MCPTSSEASRVGNYSTYQQAQYAQEESLSAFLRSLLPESLTQIIHLREGIFVGQRPQTPTRRPSMEAAVSALDTTKRQDPSILGVIYTVRSSPHFKRYNAPTPARTVIDSNGIVACQFQHSKA